MSKDIKVLAPPAPDRVTRIAVSDNNVYVVWQDKIVGESGLFFRASTDGGHIFGPKISLSSSTGVGNPELVARGNNVYITYWEVTGNGIEEPIFRASTNGGNKFHEKVMLNNTLA